MITDLKTQKIPYALSKDYSELYNLICEGNEVACFVRVYFDRDKNIERSCLDIAIVRRLEEYHINIFARGNGYGSVDPWHKEDGQEIELFKKLCEANDLGWIKP